MNPSIIFVGIDVDDQSFHGAYISSDEANQGEFRCKPTSGALIQQLKKLQTPGTLLKICYEATYLGFSLCRDLRKRGFDCELICPSSIPETRGPRVKTDRIDAQKIVRYYKNGLLSVVHVPDLQDETVRDLLRTRSFLVQQASQVRAHILSVCRRMGLHFKDEPGKTSVYWSAIHIRWLESKAQASEHSAFKANLKALMIHLKQIEDQIEIYDKIIEGWSHDSRYEGGVKALTCYRGISLTSAMTLVTEIGDIRRFAHPSPLVSYLGLDIAEYSSGGKERKGSITRMGNKRVRTTLVESSQSAGRLPNVSRHLKARRAGTDEKLTAIADRCMKRLYHRYQHLHHRGKHKNKIVVACAREMSAFVWESLTAARKIA